MQRIIGHRGAAGLELENTSTSLQRAMRLDIYAIEFDLRLTKDERLVLSHDEDLQFIADDKRHISDLTLEQLKQVPLVDGSTILTLEEALEITKGMRVIIEIKDHGSAHLVLNILEKHPGHDYIVITPLLDEAALLRSIAPDLTIYSVEHTRPIESIHVARQLRLNGVALNYWLLNPLSYWYAQRNGLELYVYSVNSKPLARFLNWLYPEVGICTDHPEIFVRRRHVIKKKAQTVRSAHSPQASQTKG